VEASARPRADQRFVVSLVRAQTGKPSRLTLVVTIPALAVGITAAAAAAWPGGAAVRPAVTAGRSPALPARASLADPRDIVLDAYAQPASTPPQGSVLQPGGPIKRKHHRTAQHRRAHHRYGWNPRRTARRMLHRFGWSKRQFKYLNWLWERESSWRVHALNPYSGAYGIPQAVPGAKMASAGRNWRNCPRVQIRWGLRYIRSRYGSPKRAWEHEVGSGWYIVLHG
jgi:hypothetical protein